MTKILLTHAIPEKGLKLLNNKFEVEILSDPSQLSQKIGQADYLITLLSVGITPELLNKATNLKMIAQYAVGYNNIAIDTAKEKGIKVTNTPGVLTNATADLTWALILSVSRRMIEADNICRSGGKWAWLPEFLLGKELNSQTIGIIGLGRIGLAVAKRALGFDMKVIYNCRTRNKELEEKYGFEYCEISDLLSKSDIISLHVPYTENTHHLIDEKEFSLLKKDAILINTSRGKVINEKVLIEYLKEKKIAGAGLDVFYDEPSIPKGLRECENVVMSPHIGSATVYTRDEMAVMVAQNILAHNTGKVPPNLIPEMRNY